MGEEKKNLPERLVWASAFGASIAAQAHTLPHGCAIDEKIAREVADYALRSFRELEAPTPTDGGERG